MTLEKLSVITKDKALVVKGDLSKVEAEIVKGDLFRLHRVVSAIEKTNGSYAVRVERTSENENKVGKYVTSRNTPAPDNSIELPSGKPYEGFSLKMLAPKEETPNPHSEDLSERKCLEKMGFPIIR